MKRLPLSTCLAVALLTATINVVAKPLVVCTEASPEGFDMVQYTTAVTADAAAETIFNRLVDFAPGTTDVEPALAERWEVSPDQLEYTFYLRPGVKFHSTDYFTPSREMNADDVLWSFQRQLDPGHPWHNKSLVGFPYFESMSFKHLLNRVEKIDEHTVKFTLNHPESPFLRNLGMAFTSIYSAEYADQLLKAGKTNELNSKPIGTGPFIFGRYSKDAQVRFKANPDYFRGTPPSSTLIFAISNDSNVRLQKLRANECQIAVGPKPEDVRNIKADPNLKIEDMTALSVSYISINTQKPFLSDVRVRKAIDMAFDRQAYLKAVYGEGNALIAINPFPPTMLGFNQQLSNPPRDLDKARALLKEAGVPEGQTFTFYTRNGGGPNNPNPLLGAQLLQADLAEIGIKMNIRVMEWAEMLKRAKNGEHDLVAAGWAGDNGDPDNFLTPMLSCAAAENGENYSRWCNQDFEALITKARRISQAQERAALYEQALQIVHNDQPWINVVHPVSFIAMRKNVEGFHSSPLMNHNFATTLVK